MGKFKYEIMEYDHKEQERNNDKELWFKNLDCIESQAGIKDHEL